MRSFALVKFLSNKVINKEQFRYFGASHGKSSHNEHSHGVGHNQDHSKDSHGHGHSKDSHGDDHSHGHDEPHVPVFYDNLGKACIVFCLLWVFYRAKENNGQLFVRFKIALN